MPVIGRPSPWRTPEREALLREQWRSGAFRADILAALRALPGAPIPSAAAMDIWAAKLQLGRHGLANAPGPRAWRVTTWNAERLALLAARFPTTKWAGDFALLAALNRLPAAAQISNIQTMRQQAIKLGLSRPREMPAFIPRRAPPRSMAPLPAPPPRPAPQPAAAPGTPEQADAALARRHARALELLARRTTASVVANACRLELREVFRLDAQLRAEARAA